MSQRKYALELLKCGNVLNDKPISTPLDPVQSLNLTDGEPLPDPSLYRTLVGKLIYLTITRSDISFAAQLLSKFSQAPRTPHMKPLLRVLSSKKQTVVSMSFTEAQYRALADCPCKITWLKCLFKDLKLRVQGPIPIYCDNSSTIAHASNPIQHA
ncbi:cysteine-rich receptor-like protein kinase 8 [Tanacetum coccineum]